MTVLIAGIITFAVISAYHLGREAGRVDRLFELLDANRDLDMLRRENDELRALLSMEQEFRG